MDKSYIPAYTITNEDWRWAREITRGAQHILTVAGSGDQALTYRLGGAKTVDTYDITKCAGIIQEIKTAAIPVIPRDEYYQLLRELRYSANPLNMFSMTHVVPRLRPQTIDLMRSRIDVINFSRGTSVDGYPQNQFTDDEYKHLQQIIRGPFEFFNCDITELNLRAIKKYDLIDISNIFDYGYERRDQIDILARLTKCLMLGGRIISMPQSSNISYDKFKIELKTGEVLQHEKTERKNCFERIHIFQRTR